MTWVMIEYVLSIFSQEVVTRFENQGDTTEHLEELKKENEKQINRLKEDLDKLTSEFEEMKYSGEAKLSRFVIFVYKSTLIHI